MTLFSEFYAGLMLFLTIRHYLKMHLEVKTFAKIVFSALVMGAVVFMFSHLNVLLLIVIGSVVYGSFLYGLGAISKETVREIVRINKSVE